MFYHETGATIGKNHNPGSELFTSHSSRTMAPCTHLVWETSANDTPLDRTHLSPDMDDFAVNYFHAYHFMFPSRVTDPNYDILIACIKAHGLATCAVKEQSSVVKLKARRYYLKAIQKVNAALATGHSTSDDDILLAAMILGTIETVTDSGDVPLDGWSSHVRGCTAMLEARGLEQVRTPEGRLLFMRVSACLMSLCLFSSSRMPPIVRVLTDEASKYVNQPDGTTDPSDRKKIRPRPWPQHTVPDEATWAMHQQGLLTLANANSDMKHGRISNAKEAVAQILWKAEQLCTTLHQAMPGLTNRPSDLASATVTFQEAFDRYMKIQTSNSMRSCSILMHVMIKELLAVSSDEQSSQAQIQASTTLVDDLKAQILASIPYQVTLAQKYLSRKDVPNGYPNLRQLLSPPAGVSTAVFVAAKQFLSGISTTRPSVFTAQDPPILRVSHGYNFISSLLVVGWVSAPESEERQETCRLLRLVGESFEVPQAKIFAERLEQER